MFNYQTRLNLSAVTFLTWLKCVYKVYLVNLVRFLVVSQRVSFINSDSRNTIGTHQWRTSIVSIDTLMMNTSRQLVTKFDLYDSLIYSFVVYVINLLHTGKCELSCVIRITISNEVTFIQDFIVILKRPLQNYYKILKECFLVT